MLDFRTETFLAVCEEMNYTKAAAILNITQPAVSQHIRYLENYYGTKLLEQNGKKMRLTKQGVLLRNALITMKHDEILLRRSLKELPQEMSLVFGVTMTVGEYLVAKPLEKYLKKHSDTSIKMIADNTQALLHKLDEGTIDFALVEGFFSKNEYDFKVYDREPFVAVCGNGYMDVKHGVEIDELLSHRLIVRERGSGTREILERYLQEKNLRITDFKQVLEVGSIGVIKELVMAGEGITFLYRVAVEKELEKGQIRQIQIHGFQLMHDITFIWRSGSIFADHYKKLFDELRESFPAV
ncbi:MAG: LysR substrate-binding domain-containing protein [Christensenella sp.]|nr:LysR substrate-binding domain-containing protein [Christensenella sp.]